MGTGWPLNCRKDGREEKLFVTEASKHADACSDGTRKSSTHTHTQFALFGPSSNPNPKPNPNRLTIVRSWRGQPAFQIHLDLCKLIDEDAQKAIQRGCIRGRNLQLLASWLVDKERYVWCYRINTNIQRRERIRMYVYLPAASSELSIMIQCNLHE